jgi:hypothetical protein
MISSVTSSDLGPAVPPDKEHEIFIFEVSMEIKEEDGRVSTDISNTVKGRKNVFHCLGGCSCKSHIHICSVLIGTKAWPCSPQYICPTD